MGVDRRYKGGRKGRGEDGNQNYTIYGREKKKKKIEKRTRRPLIQLD